MELAMRYPAVARMTPAPRRNFDRGFMPLQYTARQLARAVQQRSCRHATGNVPDEILDAEWLSRASIVPLLPQADSQNRRGTSSLARGPADAGDPRGRVRGALNESGHEEMLDLVRAEPASN